ncbi:hypothetical protein LCGC14_1529220, partial [marine sediment metagenome]
MNRMFIKVSTDYCLIGCTKESPSFDSWFWTQEDLESNDVKIYDVPVFHEEDVRRFLDFGTSN